MLTYLLTTEANNNARRNLDYYKLVRVVDSAKRTFIRRISFNRLIKLSAHRKLQFKNYK